ncbi:phenylalanine--tRNA ligase subunit beta [Candidatus Woesearchaeota archaeon CG10_big_fil_rev_8_21_14_0_10_44_13]|nr:MAG: phenylalanine--tRNA ligase subunit beta [Candidatus Woesearchaeota archaeon CG10_big_fil_rev_8_21_14_0_10_44_13]
MPTITLNKKVFESLVGKKLTLEVLKENISYLGTDLEKIEGNEIHVEVFPNRPDMLSEQGFARALSSFIGAKKGLREYKVERSGEKLIVDRSVANVRPYTACAIVKDLRFDDEKIREVIEIQEKLHITYGRKRKRAAIGIYPYEKITPPIRFVAKNPKEIKFLPLEANKVMDGLQILSQHPTGREYAHLLEDKEKFPIFIDAKNNILSMPPIINSHDVGKITTKTRDVFIECSGFDFNVLSTCINIIVTALADMGGRICSMELIYPDKKRITPDLKPREMKLDLGYVNRRLGLDLKESEAAECLRKMGYGYAKGKVFVPAYRADILHQADLAEDIAIAYGYNNIKEEIPKVATIAHEDDFEVFKRKLANILVGLELTEVNTYHLIDKDMQTKSSCLDAEVVEIIDSVSKDYNSLRFWMTPSLLNVLKNNKHNEYPQKIFEMGTIFKRSIKTESGVEEASRLCVLLCHGKTDFTEIKQVMDYVFRMINVKCSVSETEFRPFLAGRCGRVSVNGEDVAYIGEINPEALKNFELDMPVAALELNLTDLFEAMNK